MKRRQFLIGGGILGLASGGIVLNSYQQQRPLGHDGFSPQDFSTFPALALASSAVGEFHDKLKVVGALPKSIEGTLYRNGPGLFDRGGRRKLCLLDGDGMVQAFTIKNGEVTYRNRFVRTQKFVEEERAGEFLHPSWTTQAPGGFWRNLVAGRYPNQAGITVVHRNGRLFAFDEYKMPYEIDPKTLETIGLKNLGLSSVGTVVSAHSKIDQRNGDWIFFGLEYGKDVILHLTILNSAGKLKNHQKAKLPRYTYLHDFFVTNNHVLLNLHPVELDLMSLLSARQSMVAALRWREELGNQVLVFKRDGQGAYQNFEAPPSWMWHSMNAYEPKDGQLVVDFVGYDFPDHLLGPNPALMAIMKGERVLMKNHGTLRRYLIDLKSRRLRHEILDGGNFEFPYVDPAVVGRSYRYGYAAEILRDDVFYNALVRFDLVRGTREVFDFGVGRYCSEPIFVPNRSGRGEGDGWVLVQGHDGVKRKGFLAVFDAQRVDDGPLAMCELNHAFPLSFHGCWVSES